MKETSASEPALKTLAVSLATLATAASGAGAAWLVGFPAPFLTGPATLVAIVALCGIKMMLPHRILQAALLMLGVGIGASVTPDVIDQAIRWPLSFILLALSVVIIMALARRMLERMDGYDRPTAVLASAPGHLSFVLSLSNDVDADIRRISLVQTIRVMALTLIVPVAATLLGSAPAVEPTDASTMSMPAIAVAVLLSIALGVLFKRWRVPAAILIAGMSVSTVGHLSGLMVGTLPQWLAIPAFVVMGAVIGARFTGVTVAMVRQSLAAGLLVTGLASIVALALAAVVAIALDLPMGQVLIAFMPGGLEAMIAIAVLLDADPAFVAAHHIARLFMLTAIIPLMLRRGAKSPPGSDVQ